MSLPPVGTRYRAVHRVRVRFAGAEEGTLIAELLLEVTAQRATEIDLRIEASLLEDDRSVAAFDEVTVTLDSTGHLVGPTRSRCVDPDFDELVSTRLVSGILASRPRRQDADASSWPGLIVSELDESRTETTYERESGPPSLVEVRASGRLALRAASLFGASYRGAVDATVAARLSETDPIEGRSRLVLHGEVEARSREGVRRGLLEVTSDTEIRRIDASAEPAAPRHCARGFSSDLLVRSVQDQMSAFTGCYDRALALDPALHGRLLIEFTVSEEGGTEALRVAESSIPMETDPNWASVGGCVIDLLDAFSFAEGPMGGATFAFPFAFEPEGDAPH